MTAAKTSTTNSHNDDRRKKKDNRKKLTYNGKKLLTNKETTTKITMLQTIEKKLKLALEVILTAEQKKIKKANLVFHFDRPIKLYF